MTKAQIIERMSEQVDDIDQATGGDRGQYHFRLRTRFVEEWR